MSLLTKYRKNKNTEEEIKKINEFLVDLDKDNDIKLRDASTRNIFFVGRTRAGKSTVLKILKDPRSVAKEASIFSDTVDPILYSFTVEAQCYDNNIIKLNVNSPVKDDKKPIEEKAEEVSNVKLINYNINIIDTPGLFEQKINIREIRNNSVIKKMILKCMESEITKIHVIFFVCSFVSGVQYEDIEAFSEFLTLFKGAEKNIAMLITRSEKYTEERKKELTDEIVQHHKLKEFKKQINNNIYFTGAPNINDYNRGNSDTFIEDALSVIIMRKRIYDFIFQCDKYCELRKLDYFIDQAQIVDKLQDKIQEQQLHLQDKTIALEDKAQLELVYQQNLIELKNLKGFVDEKMGIKYREIMQKDDEINPNNNDKK